MGMHRCTSLYALKRSLGRDFRFRSDSLQLEVRSTMPLVMERGCRGQWRTSQPQEGINQHQLYHS